MGLYNIVFRTNDAAPLLLGVLNLTTKDVGRFRDAFVSEGRIAVYTRNGGGNRATYMPDFSKHPNYLYDKDDSFDSTYATIYFSIPEEHKELLDGLDIGTFDPDRRWAEALEALKAGKRLDVIEAMAPTFDRILNRTRRYAPEGFLWVCTACGKTTADRLALVDGWDESCMLNCELLAITRLVMSGGRVVKVNA